MGEKENKIELAHLQANPRDRKMVSETVCESHTAEGGHRDTVPGTHRSLSIKCGSTRRTGQRQPFKSRLEGEHKGPVQRCTSVATILLPGG